MAFRKEESIAAVSGEEEAKGLGAKDLGLDGEHPGLSRDGDLLRLASAGKHIGRGPSELNSFGLFLWKNITLGTMVSLTKTLCCEFSSATCKLFRSSVAGDNVLLLTDFKSAATNGDL